MYIPKIAIIYVLTCSSTNIKLNFLRTYANICKIEFCTNKFKHAYVKFYY